VQLERALVDLPRAHQFQLREAAETERIGLRQTEAVFAAGPIAGGGEEAVRRAGTKRVRVFREGRQRGAVAESCPHADAADEGFAVTE